MSQLPGVAPLVGCLGLYLICLCLFYLHPQFYSQGCIEVRASTSLTEGWFLLVPQFNLCLSSLILGERGAEPIACKTDTSVQTYHTL